MKNLLHKPYMRSYHHVSFFYQLKSNCIIQQLIQIVNFLPWNHMSDLWRVAEEKKPMSEKIKEQLQFTQLISYCSTRNFPARISSLKFRNRLSMVSKNIITWLTRKNNWNNKSVEYKRDCLWSEIFIKGLTLQSIDLIDTNYVE